MPKPITRAYTTQAYKDSGRLDFVTLNPACNRVQFVSFILDTMQHLHEHIISLLNKLIVIFHDQMSVAQLAPFFQVFVENTLDFQGATHELIGNIVHIIIVILQELGIQTTICNIQVVFSSSA